MPRRLQLLRHLGLLLDHRSACGGLLQQRQPLRVRTATPYDSATSRCSSSDEAESEEGEEEQEEAGAEAQGLSREEDLEEARDEGQQEEDEEEEGPAEGSAGGSRLMQGARRRASTRGWSRAGWRRWAAARYTLRWMHWHWLMVVVMVRWEALCLSEVRLSALVLTACHGRLRRWSARAGGCWRWQRAPAAPPCASGCCSCWQTWAQTRQRWCR
jgi:hypothetical protein